MKRKLGGIAAALLLLAAGCGGGKAQPKATKQAKATKPPATAQPKATKQAKATPVSAQIAWGAAVNGLTAGLEIKNRRFEVGEPISFTIHVRNQGKRAAILARGAVWEGWSFQFQPPGTIRGGSLVAEFRPAAGGKRPESLTVAPGEEAALPVIVGRVSQGQWNWYWHTDFNTKEAIVSPEGKVSVCVCYGPLPSDPAGSWNRSFNSDSVEIEIVAPGAAGTVKPPATKASSPPPSPKGRGSATPAATPAVAWGEAVNGIQAGLEAPRRTFRTTDEEISLTIHVRNQGKETITLPHAGEARGWGPQIVPVNGGPAYQLFNLREMISRSREPRPLTLAGGEEKTLWVGIGQSGSSSFFRQGEDKLKGLHALPPGRYRLTFYTRDTSGTGLITTGPVEIEIVAPGAAGTVKPPATKAPSPPPSPKGRGSAPPAATPPASVKPAAPLTEAEARALATKLANAELAKDSVRGAGGRPVPADLRPESWQRVAQRNGRWELEMGPPAEGGGFRAEVSFNLDGSGPRVLVSANVQ